MATELSVFIASLKLYQPIGSVRRPDALNFVNDYPRFIKVLEDIDNLIGLETAKTQVTQQVKAFIVNQRRFGKPTHKELLHTLIYGPPGSGKTQLGEYLAELWAVSGCLPKDDGVNPFQIDPNESSSQNPLTVLQQMLQSSSQIDNEKSSLRQNFILKDSQVRHLQEQLRNNSSAISNLLTQFNNVRKKVRAKIEVREPQIQTKFQVIKEGLKHLVDSSSGSPPPEILPVTIPRDPGVRSIFGQSQPPLLPLAPSRPQLDIFSQLPVLKKKIVKFVRLTRGDLIAKYQGHGTANLRKFLSKYVGGVIMLDEAYNFLTSSHDDFGKEILTEIINVMTTHPDKFIFIFAGYRKDMEETVLKLQQGLSRRFNWTFEIETYTPKELSLIFQRQIRLRFGDQACKFSEETLRKIDKLFEENKEKFPHYGGDTDRLCGALKEVMGATHWVQALDETISTEQFNRLFEEVEFGPVQEAYEKYLKNSVAEKGEKAKKKKEEEEKMKNEEAVRKYNYHS